MNEDKKASKLLVAVKTAYHRILQNGEWDDGCFYYKGTSASELEEPLRLMRAAIAEEEAKP